MIPPGKIGPRVTLHRILICLHPKGRSTFKICLVANILNTQMTGIKDKRVGTLKTFFEPFLKIVVKYS